MPLMTTFSSLSHPTLLPRRGSVNSPNHSPYSFMTQRSKQFWRRFHVSGRATHLAQPILHKPSSFPALHELIFANFHNLSLIIFLTLRMLFAYLHQVDFSQDRYLCESWLLFKHYIFQRFSISCKAAQPATNNWYVRSRVPIMQLELLSRLWWF